MPTRTDKVPNTSATAASAGTDLNGAAVLDACTQLRATLAPVAARCWTATPATCASRRHVSRQAVECTFRSPKSCEAAYRQRMPLFAQGYYRTPEIHYDPKTGRGRPFHYFAYGAAVSEVEVDGFTGEYRLLRADILQDVGDSHLADDRPRPDRRRLHPGVGWLTLEELVWDAQGRLATDGASTYKLPSWSEVPDEFNVAFLQRATEPAWFRQQGGRRAAADAGDLRARGDPRRDRGVRRRHRRTATRRARPNASSSPCRRRGRSPPGQP